MVPPQAGMAELVDAPDLGSGIARCAGSSPVPGTNRTGTVQKIQKNGA